MRRIPIPAALALLAALPGPAEAQTSWTGSNLSVSGHRADGCDLRVIEVSHSGSSLHSLRFVIANLSGAARRVTADVTITGNNQHKTGPITGLIGAGQLGTLLGFYPPSGSLAGTRVELRVLSCTMP